MTDDPLPLGHQQRLALTAADDRPPGWVWPALGLGAAWPALIAATRRDADLLRRLRPAPGTGDGRLGRVGELPGLPAAILVGTALVLAVLFGFVRLGIHDVYTESWLFLALALVLGLASPAAGLVLVLAFIPMDLLAVMTRGALHPILAALAAEAIAWWLLFLLVVALPLIARQVPAAILATTRPANANVRRALGYVGGMVVIAGLAWTWCAGATELLAPVFTWADPTANPPAAATGPLADGRTGLMVVGALAVLGWTLLRDLFRGVDDEAAADAVPPAWPRPIPMPDPRLAPVRWAIVVVVGLVALGGMITAPLDVVLLGAALLAARPGVHWVLGRFPVALLVLGQVPWIARLAAGIALAWLASTVLTFILTGPAFGSERFPVVVATAVSLMVLALLLEADATADERMRASEARAAARPPDGGSTDEPTVVDGPGVADEPGVADGPGTADGAAVADDSGVAGEPGTADGPAVADPDAISRFAATRRARLATLAATTALVLLPAVALAQGGGTPCPIGERCLPDAGTMAASAAGAAALLLLTFGTAGRFVSIRRDAATRGATPDADAATTALPVRVRAAILAAWRAG